jgi:outer membrane protein insertion porin family
MRTPIRALAALLLFSPFLTPRPASAQYSIAKVVFHNPGPYTDAELLSVTGLQSGQMLLHDSLVNAATHLLNTGLFSDAQVDLSGIGKVRTVVIDLKPIPLSKLLPASFENFVWFTPDELTAGIHAHVPLYRGVASDAGTLPDDIQSALQQMLFAKGITATLSHEIIEPTNLHPRLTVNFKVDSPAITLAKADITGIPDTLKADTLHSIQRLEGDAYNEGLTGATVEDIALAPARTAGYLNAKLQDVHRSLAPTSSGIAVTYTATFVPGDAYKVSTITWNPTPIYSAADFARDAKLHPGDPASNSALFQTEAPISKAYLLQGYMDVYILPNPVLDSTTHTVSYTLTATPGEIYHLHSLTVDGLSPQARALFDADWPMKPGDPYSDLAVNAFLMKHVAQPVFRTYSPEFKAIGDPQTHLVDLTLTFTPNGSKDY